LCTNIKARPSAESRDMINGKQFTELLALSELWMRGLTAVYNGVQEAVGLLSQQPAGKSENQTVFILRSQELEQI